MIKLAFCDDEVSELNEICRLLAQYCEEHKREITYAAFQSPLNLLSEVEKGARFDIVLLDVFMPGENGMDAAAEIRNYDSNVKIIFLTSSSDFAMQSYAVGAYFYQLKPLGKESFFRLMDSVLLACEEEEANSILLRCKSGITRIKLRQLEYCEVIHHTLLIHLSSGKVLECAGSLDEIFRLLQPHGNFFRPHRSYIVNLEYVNALSGRGVTMSSQAEIPIPRGKYHEMKEAYLEYAFRNRQVVV